RPRAAPGRPDPARVGRGGPRARGRPHAAPAEPRLSRPGRADRRALVPGPGGGPRRHRDQRAHGGAQRAPAGAGPAPGDRRPGPARLPARPGLRPRDGRRRHGPLGGAAAPPDTGAAVSFTAMVKLAVLAVLALASLALAAVEAAFYLLKRRRLGHLA